MFQVLCSFPFIFLRRSSSVVPGLFRRSLFIFSVRSIVFGFCSVMIPALQCLLFGFTAEPQSCLSFVNFKCNFPLMTPVILSFSWTKFVRFHVLDEGVRFIFGILRCLIAKGRLCTSVLPKNWCKSWVFDELSQANF